jgi:hypothetical protein
MTPGSSSTEFPSAADGTMGIVVDIVAESI